MPRRMVPTPDRVNFGGMAEAGLGAIWNGECYRAFRGALDGGEPPEVRRSCAVYSGTF